MSLRKSTRGLPPQERYYAAEARLRDLDVQRRENPGVTRRALIVAREMRVSSRKQLADYEIVQELAHDSAKFLQKLENTVFDARRLALILTRDPEIGEEAKREVARIFDRLMVNINQLTRADRITNPPTRSWPIRKRTIGEMIGEAEAPLYESKRFLFAEPNYVGANPDFLVLRNMATETAIEARGKLEEAFDKLSGRTSLPPFEREIEAERRVIELIAEWKDTPSPSRKELMLKLLTRSKIDHGNASEAMTEAMSIDPEMFLKKLEQTIVYASTAVALLQSKTDANEALIKEKLGEVIELIQLNLLQLTRAGDIRNPPTYAEGEKETRVESQIALTHFTFAHANFYTNDGHVTHKKALQLTTRGRYALVKAFIELHP